MLAERPLRSSQSTAGMGYHALANLYQFSDISVAKIAVANVP
jgi:hypothetical protein